MTRRRRRVLVLAHRHDAGAAAVARALAARLGPPGVVCVPPDRLVAGSRWSHALDDEGRAAGELVLASGVRLVAEEVDAVLDRAGALPLARFARAGARDRDYAAMEAKALLASWLHGLGCPVVNRMDGDGPAGRGSPLWWRAAAAECGLPVLGYAVASSARLLSRERTPAVDGRGPWPEAPFAGRQPAEASAPAGPPARLLVTGERVHGPLAPLAGAGAVRLAERAGCALLELTFARSDDGWLFAGAEPAPALLGPGEADAVADLLAGAQRLAVAS